MAKSMRFETMDGRNLDALSEEEVSKLDFWTDVKRVIEELEVFEVSVVNIPANP